ncbi:MAG: hypothetical protein ABI435_05640 [Pseudolysinimonas sp.]
MTRVEYLGGRGDLGKWGYIELSGARSALVHSLVGEDFELPEDVALDLTHGDTFLDTETGRLFFFPSHADLIHAYNINSGQPVFEPVGVDGEEDPRDRWRGVWVLENAGLLCISEYAVFFFTDDLNLAWAVRGDFSGWSVQRSEEDTVTLAYADFGGRSASRRYRLSDGVVVD